MLEFHVYLRSIGFEFRAILKFCGMDTRALVWLPFGKYRFVRLLRSEARCLNEMLAGGRDFTVGSLEGDCPFLGFRIISSQCDIGRVDNIQVKSLYISFHMIGELVSSEHMG